MLSALRLLVGCTLPIAKPETPTRSLAPIQYQNVEYGFSFWLPASWKGYSIVTDQWEGDKMGDQGEIAVEHGPIISIRHSQWTSEHPRQDIPIMVFTLEQWNSLQQGDFVVSAAGIGPTELGHNAKYVFAIPPRYNFADVPGIEEVKTILEGNPLQTP